MLRQYPLPFRRRDRDERQGRRAERHAQRHDQPVNRSGIDPMPMTTSSTSTSTGTMNH